MKQWSEQLVLFLKGVAMGIGNIIPGVSGGTIALITGIYERFIHAFRSWDITALRMLLRGDIKGMIRHTDMGFITMVFLGVLTSIVVLAKVLGYTFIYYPVYTWSYFFGLILASIYFVGKTVEKWNVSVFVAMVTGIAIALAISFFSPATPNDNGWYLFLCGIVAVCSMMLPGLSGSFVLILMGNYELIFVYSVNNLAWNILIPVALGTLVGLVGFSRFLSWIIRRYRNVTIAVLTGFIIGSLNLLWPWQKAVYKLNQTGDMILKANGEPILIKYRKFLPDGLNREVIWAVAFMIFGILTIWVLEYLATKKNNLSNNA